MVINKCPSDIVIIQGDTCQKNVFIEGLEDLSSIDSVYFSCSKLQLERELTYDQDIKAYVLLITADETSKLKPMTTDFDITVKIGSSIIKTGLYRGKLYVLDKNNPVEVYSDVSEE